MTGMLSLICLSCLCTGVDQGISFLSCEWSYVTLRIPTSTVLSQERSVYEVDIDDYKREIELTLGLSQAWKLAHNNIQRAQGQKQYDRKSRPANLGVGERVMVYMPAEAQGKNWKLARPFHGPYRIISMTPSNVEV